VFKSRAQVDGLEQLVEQCRKLNGEIVQRSNAQIKAFFLNRLLNKLANIYTAATGRRATISKSGEAVDLRNSRARRSNTFLTNPGRLIRR
jgi:hypothetical protein